MTAIVIALYTSQTFDPSHGNIKKYSSWDLPEVRKYFANPENRDDMENLSKQSAQCGCK